jgi:serine/threonine protein kinase
MYSVQPFALQNIHSTFNNPGMYGTARTAPQPPSISLPADTYLNDIAKEFSYSEIRDATNGFSKSNILGTGTFGSVYRGTLPDQTQVAVKIINSPKESGFEEEVRILSKYRHPNLILVLGFARNGNERLVVYECMDNGDCERALKSRDNSHQLDWRRRLSILVDACRGLSYLISSDPIVFHRDIKPSNILLDKNWVGKMADFGLSCQLESSNAVSIRVGVSAGTMGYACPNYVSTGMVTEGSEIYSFGIVILEFLTGQPPAMNHHHFPGQTVHLVESLGCNMNALLSILDKRANWPEDLAVELGHIFFECCDRNVQKRPKFISVVKRLKGLSDRFTTYEPQQKILGNINQQIRLPKSPDVLMTSRQPQRGGDFNEFQTMMKPSVGEDRTPKSLPKATCY